MTIRPKALLASAGILLLSVSSCSKDDLQLEGRKKSTTAPTTTTSGTGTTTTSGTGTTTPSTTDTSATSGTGSGTGTVSPVTVVPAPSPLFGLNVNWTGRTDGAYGLTQATTDFRTIAFWNGANTTINGGMLRVNLQPNVVGPSGGNVSRVDVPDAPAYQLKFDMKFDAAFDFSSGGKVGFGFLIGSGYTGGTPGWDGNGGSARVMWYKGWDGRLYLKPYIYYKDQPGTYGHDFARSFPSAGSIQKDTWYNVTIYVKSNTGSNTDGHIRMVINGVTLIDQSIRWTTNDLNRLVRHVCFETFRGGAETYWQSTTQGPIYFNNVQISQMGS